MNPSHISTYAPNTWCPGCGNFSILNAVKATLAELGDTVCPPENLVLVSGIGCHAKIVDYIGLNSFYSIHGRTLPVAEGIKIGAPELKVICFAGDGDAYGEGLEHLVFAAKRNIDLTVIVHNNRVYSLTAFQYSPTSPLGFRGRSTPEGSIELPLNPLEIMLASGATFLARGTSQGLPLLMSLIKQAIMHKGFAVIDVLQVCMTFHNLYEYYAKQVYELAGHDANNRQDALTKIREWDYGSDTPIALGVFYQMASPSFEEKFSSLPTRDQDRTTKIQAYLDKMI